jgi:hypothetical protein
LSFAHRGKLISEVLASSVSRVEIGLNHHAHACESMVNTIKEQFGWKGDEANVQIRAANHGARHDHGGGGAARSVAKQTH